MALFGGKKHGQSDFFTDDSYSSMPRHNPHDQHKRQGGVRGKLYAVLAIVIIAAAAYSLYFLSVNQTVVMAPATVNLTTSGTVFSINSEQYLISLSSTVPSSGKAYIHISKLPIFINPLYNVTLMLGNITKINAGTNYSNMGVQLLSMSADIITVKVSPLYTSLQIAPDYQDIKSVQGTLYNSGQVHSGGTATAATTTVNGTTVSTTAGSTTTATSVNNTALEISDALYRDALYTLLLNFSKLYENTTSCTSQLYNTTYIRVYGHAPSAAVSYSNVTPYVPYNLSSTTESAGSGNFNVVFKTKTVSSLYNNAVAVTIKVNASNEEPINDTFAPSGVFGGLNFTKLSSNYVRAVSAVGACGVEV